MSSIHLSTAYLAPVQYYCKLFSYPSVIIETSENYPKQTYRNRCNIAGANGVQRLTIPVEKPETEKCPTKDVRISDHGYWRHLHWQTLVSAYGSSPFFEYYRDDFAPFYVRKFDFLFDFNASLQHRICELLDIHPEVKYTSQYERVVRNDYRSIIRPKQAGEDPSFHPLPYRQVFRDKHGFLPNLSIVDLLFNMGPEALFILRDSGDGFIEN